MSQGDLIKSGETLTVTLKFYYLDKASIDNNVLNSYLNFSFKIPSSLMKDNITYEWTKDGSSLPVLDLANMSDDDRKNMFSNAASESGLYKIKGMVGEDVLAYRGNVTNNYVRFAGYYWRILQIDESGNLRIILDDNLRSVSKYSSNSKASDVDAAIELVSFKSSIAKTRLDEWTKYYEPWKDRVVVSNFCNDFSYVNAISSSSKNKVTYFKSYQNIGSDSGKFNPSLICDTKSLFRSNIGLISAEEYVMAGGAFTKENKQFFLYNPSTEGYFWTLSPSYYDTVRQNTNVFIFNTNGTLFDYSGSLLEGYYYLRPVITISGNYNMLGDGTKANPYRYEETNTADMKSIDDLSTLTNNKWYIGNISSSKSRRGVLSSVSSTSSSVTGLVGKDTAFFNEKLTTISNFTGITFSFVNGVVQDDGSYLYQIKTNDGKYLKIGDDKSVSLVDEVTNCKVMLSTDSDYYGKILIANDSGTMYMNFYGSEDLHDNKFAGWNEIDKNAYMSLYKPDFE